MRDCFKSCNPCVDHNVLVSWVAFLCSSLGLAFSNKRVENLSTSPCQIFPIVIPIPLRNFESSRKVGLVNAQPFILSLLNLSIVIIRSHATCLQQNLYFHPKKRSTDSLTISTRNWREVQTKMCYTMWRVSHDIKILFTFRSYVNDNDK